MSDSKANENPMFTSPVVYQLPFAGEIKCNVSYGDPETQVMDIYYPQTRSEPVPAVILVTGFPDPGYKAMMGMIQKDVAWYESWAKLLAASGLAAITYSNTDPAADVRSVVDYLRANEDSLGIDGGALAVMAMSGNASNAVSLLLSDSSIRGAVLWYGYIMDVGDAQNVGAAAAQYGFAKPEQIDDEFPDTVPMLLLRAGLEENQGLNEAMDLFTEEAQRRGAPLTLINYAEGKHCFDIMDSSAESIEVVKKAVGFLQQKLLNS